MARPAARAERLEGPAPDTRIAPGLTALCHGGERAITVAAGPGRQPTAALGSPFDPEAFLTWRTGGIQVYFRGPVPARLELDLDATARVTASVTYQEEP